MNEAMAFKVLVAPKYFFLPLTVDGNIWLISIQRGGRVERFSEKQLSVERLGRLDSEDRKTYIKFSTPIFNFIRH